MDSTLENFDNPKLIDLFYFLFENLYWCGQSVLKSIVTYTRRVTDNQQIHELIEMLSNKLSEHPMLKFIAFASAVSCTAPIAMFIVFGLVSTAVTFSGFLFVEGILLALGGLCMIACIALMMTVISTMTLALGSLYFILLKFGALLNQFESISSLLSLPHLQINGVVISEIEDDSPSPQH